MQPLRRIPLRCLLIFVGYAAMKTKVGFDLSINFIFFLNFLLMEEIIHTSPSLGVFNRPLLQYKVQKLPPT